MLFRTMLIAAVVLTVAPVAAQAQDDVKLSPAYERCMDKPENSTTYGILKCGTRRAGPKRWKTCSSPERVGLHVKSLEHFPIR